MLQSPDEELILPEEDELAELFPDDEPLLLEEDDEELEELLLDDEDELEELDDELEYPDEDDEPIKRSAPSCGDEENEEPSILVPGEYLPTAFTNLSCGFNELKLKSPVLFSETP